MSIIALSNVAGRIPTVNQLLQCESNLGYNRRDAKWYGLKIAADDTKTVELLGESTAPALVHDRLHSMISAADHAAASVDDYGKLIGYNASTGAVETVDTGNTPFPDSGSFKGIAILSTDPGIPTEDEWWTATEVGVYSYFSGIEVTTITDKLNYLKWTQLTESWSIETVDIPGTGISQKIIELKIVSDTMNPLAGDGRLIVCIPAEMNGMTLKNAAAFVTTAGAVGAGGTSIQIRNITTGHDMLSVPIVIIENQLTSYMTPLQPVVNPAYKTVTIGNLLSVDIDTVAPASKGLGIILIF